MNLRDIRTLGGCQSFIGISLDETTTSKIVEAVFKAFGGKVSIRSLEEHRGGALPVNLRRSIKFLTHPVFEKHQSENVDAVFLDEHDDKANPFGAKGAVNSESAARLPR